LELSQQPQSSLMWVSERHAEISQQAKLVHHRVM
jgi:hypothetical protein